MATITAFPWTCPFGLFAPNSIPFSEGALTFDFEDNLDQSCEDKVKGWHPECVISPDRFKKIVVENNNKTTR